METVQIIGTLAAVLTTIANIPQTYKIIKKKSTEGLSAITYFVLLGGTLLWVIYGIMKEDWPLIGANGISSLISITVLVLYYISDKKIEEIHEKVLPESEKE